MKFENVTIGQRVQAKVDIYQFPDWEDKGRLLVKKGTLGEVIGVCNSVRYVDVEVKWDVSVLSASNNWWCNHKDIRKVKESKEVKEGVPQNKIACKEVEKNESKWCNVTGFKFEDV